VLSIVGLLVAPAWGNEQAWRWDLPPGFPAPVVPADNPMSAAKVALGRSLFFDTRLSLTGSYACASCHDPARAFTDGRGQAVGATGERHPRGAMSLVNVAYNASFGWANPTLRQLEEQAAVPMFSLHPVELGLSGREKRVMQDLLAQPAGRAAFTRAFPEESGGFTLLHVRRALSAYERTLISAGSAYDRYVFRDERDALDQAARRGMRLFFSERVGCAGCHPAPLFMSPAVYEGTQAEPRFHNTGLYNLGGTGRYPDHNPGVFEHTLEPADMGRFRVPTLRNVGKTAPYMHDGSIETLRDVVLHYAAGGRNRIASGSQEVGPRSPLQSPALQPFELNARDVDDLVAFLESLSDEDASYAADAEGRSR
jgi:cytochrome c peroxidase